MKTFVPRRLERPAVTVLACAGLCVAGGIAYAAAAGKGLDKSVAYAFFIGGGAIVVLAGISGGGARGVRADTHASGRYEPADMQFGWVVIGALLIGIGVAVLKA